MQTLFGRQNCGPAQHFVKRILMANINSIAATASKTPPESRKERHKRWQRSFFTRPQEQAVKELMPPNNCQESSVPTISHLSIKEGPKEGPQGNSQHGTKAVGPTSCCSQGTESTATSYLQGHHTEAKSRRRQKKTLRLPSCASSAFLGRLVTNLLAESCSSSSSPTCAITELAHNSLAKMNVKPIQAAPVGQTSKSWSQAPAHGLPKTKLSGVRE